MTTSATLHFSEITELTLVRLRTMPDWEAADVLDDRLRVLEVQWKRGYAERGLILLEVQERELWRHIRDREGVGYTSFERWVVGSAPYSRRDCFAALAAVKELKDIPASVLMDVPRCNIGVLQQLSSGIRSQPEVLQQAKTLSEKELLAYVAVKHPTEHIPAKTLLEQALELAMKLENCGRRAAEDIVGESYLAEHAEEAEKTAP
jgi:hypothetical protein